MLKAYDYKWDKKGKVWYQYYSSEEYNLAGIMEQAWTHAADHVIMKQYDKDDKLVDAYLFADGTVTQLKVEGEAS